MGEVFTTEGTAAGGYIDSVIPAAVVKLARNALGSKETVLAEIDAMNDAVRDFWQQSPDLVMTAVAAYSARATELEIMLHRVEGRDRSYRQIRTRQIGPLLAELDRQFKVASRLIEVRRQDLDTVRGFA